MTSRDKISYTALRPRAAPRLRRCLQRAVESL